MVLEENIKRISDRANCDPTEILTEGDEEEVEAREK